MSEEVLSVLKIEHIVVDRMCFQRVGFLTKKQASAKETMAFATERETLDTSYRVSLSVKVEREEEFVAEVHMSAFVEIDEGVEYKDELLSKNTVAILFPFIRSQMTLLTSQPDTIPVLLPAININALIEAKQKEEQGTV